MNRIIAQAGKLKRNISERYTLVLLTVGMPLVAFLYIDWKAALTTFIFIQIILGLISLKDIK